MKKKEKIFLLRTLLLVICVFALLAFSIFAEEPIQITDEERISIEGWIKVLLESKPDLTSPENGWKSTLKSSKR